MFFGSRSGDEAHVGLLSPCRRRSGADDAHFVAQKCFLAPRPLSGFQACVIWRGANTVGVEFAGQRLGVCALQ